MGSSAEELNRRNAAALGVLWLLQRAAGQGRAGNVCRGVARDMRWHRRWRFGILSALRPRGVDQFCRRCKLQLSLHVSHCDIARTRSNGNNTLQVERYGTLRLLWCLNSAPRLVSSINSAYILVDTVISYSVLAWVLQKGKDSYFSQLNKGDPEQQGEEWNKYSAPVTSGKKVTLDCAKQIPVRACKLPLAEATVVRCPLQLR